nr:M48 family metallopeptidase [Leptolyngbya sp. FACHB-36]
MVKRLEQFAQQQPVGYRWRVGLLAALGYAYIFLVLAGLGAIVALLAWLVVISQRLNTAMIKAGILLLIPAWAIVRSLQVSFPPPQGLRLTRQQVPALFALVDDLTRTLQAPSFHHILLVQDFNAAVMQVPRLGIFGWQENYLLVGLPLMQVLSPEQFRAVLAHELGHLSGNHSRFAGWIYRVRKTWMQILERLQGGHGGSSLLFDRFFNWYAPFFSAYSFVLARMDEYDADRCAAQLAGKTHCAEALMNVAVQGPFVDRCWTGIYDRVKQEVEPPSTAFSQVMQTLHGAAPIEGRQWLEQALMQKTSNADTHPCLSDRLAALGFQKLDNLPLPQPVRVTAAQQFLGSALELLIKQFDHEWKQGVETTWRQRYAYLQETRAELQALNEKASRQALTVDEAWERACRTLELEGDAAATPLIQAVVTLKPDHAAAHYTLGRILLEQNNPEGIAHVEAAIAQNVDWVLEGCQLIYGFLWQRGQVEEAKQYRDRAEHQYELLMKAQQERSDVSDRDLLKPHTLTEAEIADLKQQLATYPQVKEAYVVEKVMTHFPEKRFCVLGIIRKRNLIEGEAAAQKLVDLLATNLQFPVQSYILILNHGNIGKLRKKMTRVERSLIFQR